MYNNNNVSEKKQAPSYAFVAPNGGPTPMQREREQVQQQINNNPNGYPGVIGGTPAASKGVQGYDAQGNPIIPPFIAQRHQIEQSLGPTCPKGGGYHDLRMHLTGTSLLFAVLIVPYCCGYRGRRVCVCTKCSQKFPNIVLPSA
ncbi:hypothetical protein BDF20DRAFT_695051 [Mycotypha africana]|uniref:uncharacterized protein n=1 Tax=Mycotypha africana TaxID=64632 RepID=UPI00230101B7|nr:uncharacterized protein BDF20DRAFT_695051 [Mycotypha africana]KAI8971720.1 hypothetical protein BDF20DRAFT_695051 [Mycotypha africana]